MQYKKIAGYESITISIILLLMILYKMFRQYLPYRLNNLLSGVMGENNKLHILLYSIILLLSLSSGIIILFFDDDV